MKHLENYHSQFDEVLNIIQGSRKKVIQVANTHLINLYWDVGEYVSHKVEHSDWGKGVVKNLSLYIQQKDPTIKGFSDKNIWRMKQLYETYHDNEKLSPLVRQLKWSNNLLILSKTKTIEEKEFYLNLATKENYSKRDLERLLDTGCFERTALFEGSASKSVLELHPDAKNVFKDSYLIDFLDLPSRFSEKTLQKSIVQNLKQFLLELGKDFCFIGEEYRVQVGNQDFFIDLLCFHRGLSCLVAFELKVTSFKPEHLGQISFYLETLDRDVKKAHENPSVGVLLCKDKDQEVVEYALNRHMSPTLVAEYQTKLIDKVLLQEKLHEFYQISENSES